MYKALNAEEKEAWNERAEADKARYLHELSMYQPPPGFDMKGDAIASLIVMGPSKSQSKATRDPNAPKKSTSHSYCLIRFVSRCTSGGESITLPYYWIFFLLFSLHIQTCHPT